MTIFTYKLATYRSSGDGAVVQNTLFRGSCRVSRVRRVCSGIPGSCEVRARARVSFRL